jgi:DNA-binding NarL/FixJ family response regulator
MPRKVFPIYMTSASRVLVADDHPLFREALVHVIKAVCPNASCSEVSNYGEMLELTREDETFDLIFVDLIMPGGDYFDELFALKKRLPLTPTIIISSREDRPTIQRAMACGAAGYLPKSMSRAGMESAIRAVLAGGVYVPDDTVRHGRGDPGRLDPFLTLTTRQYAVLERLARGNSNRQIAVDLGIEEVTVKVHISAILRKFNVNNRLQAVVAFRSFLERTPQ